MPMVVVLVTAVMFYWFKLSFSEAIWMFEKCLIDYKCISKVELVVYSRKGIKIEILDIIKR